jgi:hypothetical protein
MGTWIEGEECRDKAEKFRVRSAYDTLPTPGKKEIFFLHIRVKLPP